MGSVFVGLTTLDVVQRVERLPGVDEKVAGSAAQVGVGGPAANAARTYAALGGRPRLLTALGATRPGRWARELLEDAGVQVIDLAEPDASPPLASVLVDASTGRRAIIDSPPTGRLAPGTTLAATCAERVAGASGLLLDGHHADLAVAAARAARAVGVPVVLDAGRPKPVWAALVPLADVAVCSADFRAPGSSEADPDRIAGLLIDGGVRQVAITAGSAPLTWWDAFGGRVLTGRIQPTLVDAVDTLGAGDVLHGAFCFHRDAGLGFVEALAAASALASERCATIGLDAWLASFVRRPPA